MVIEVFPQKVFDKEQIKRDGSVTTECVQGSLKAASFKQHVYFCLWKCFLGKDQNCEEDSDCFSFVLQFWFKLYCSIFHVHGC